MLHSRTLQRVLYNLYEYSGCKITPFLGDSYVIAFLLIHIMLEGWENDNLNPTIFNLLDWCISAVGRYCANMQILTLYHNL